MVATNELAHLDSQGLSRLTCASVDMEIQADCIPIRTEVWSYGSTGVEMEGLTAGSISARREMLEQIDGEIQGKLYGCGTDFRSVSEN